MHDQPKLEPLEATDQFPGGPAARQPPKGTVPRALPGERTDQAFASGIDETGQYTDSPVPVSRDLLLRGKQRFGIYCSPCHGLAGDGEGMIVQRGYKRPPSLHIDRLRQQKAGYFVDVIENGFGVMPSYAALVTPPDRWAIAAYVGALQLSQSASFSDLPPEDAAHIEALQ